MKKGSIFQTLVILLSIFSITSCKTPELQKKPNILLICIDDLRPELKSFGAQYISSPNIDALAEKGVSFQQHFVNAPSCGPSRYTLLTGQYGPADNYALFKRATKIAQGIKVKPSMPEWFRKAGYTTVSVGKVSHHPGGRGGADWNDSSAVEMPNAWDKHMMPVAEWEHPRGMMHGLAHGEIRKNVGDMAIFQSAEGDDAIYPDGAIAKEAVKQLGELAKNDDKPFFLAFGIIKPHLPFGAPKRYYDMYENVKLPEIAHPEQPEGRTTWHKSGEFMNYNRWGKNPNEDKDFALAVRRHYAACVSYADAQVGKIMAELKRTGADKNTIVILWGDHGWHLGEHAIWGKHSLFEESLNSPLIIYNPTVDNGESFKTNAVVETVDLFPTLCELTGVKMPDFINGLSLTSNLTNPNTEGHAAVAYTSKASTIRTADYRMTLHKDGFVELYNHNTKEDGETKNIAKEQPEMVAKLKAMLKSKMN